MAKRTWILIPALLVLGLVLSACGSAQLAKDLTPIPTLPPGETPTLIAAIEGGSGPAPEAEGTAEASDAGTSDEDGGEAMATEAAGESSEPDVALGEELFAATCSGCHGEEDGAGPARVGMGERAAERVEGMSAEEYLHEAIVEPGAYVVEGFQNIMPSNYGDQYSEHELDSLVAYLLEQ